MNFWQGTKISLRAIEPSDVEAFSRWNLDSERARNYDFVWPPVSRAAMQAWAETQARRKFEHDTFQWVIQNRDGEPVGAIDTHDCNARNGTFSYGIDIAEEQRRQGYASEAIQLVVSYYFEELRYQKVTVDVHGDNEPSLRLHEALGFQREGAHRRMLYMRGHFVDVVWFGMTIDEFRDRRPSQPRQ